MLDETNHLSDQQPKLLVVDDEPIIRKRLEELGKLLGFEVYTAEDGVDGVYAFTCTHPDIVLLDVYMPRKNGFKALQEMKMLDPECPVVLITGFLRYEQLVHTGGMEADAYLTKPFDIPKISTLLLDLLDSRMAVA